MKTGTALITGITGQTGSYLAEILSDDSWEVHGTGLNPVSQDSSVPYTFHDVDLADPEGMAMVLESIEPDVIFNLAAISSVAASWENPIQTTKTNALAVAEMLNLAQRSCEKGRPIKVIQASSAEIFDAYGTLPFCEDSTIRPRNPYGISKAYSHLLVNSYAAKGLPFSNAILFNHESPRRPHSFVTRKITSSVAAISLGLMDDFTLGDMSVRRDWGWAPDYSRALYQMACSNKVQDFVVATGKSHSIKDFVETAFEVVGILDWSKYVQQDKNSFRPTDTAEQRGDASKIQSELGWAPTLDFRGMISRMIEADLIQLKKTS